MIQLRHVGLYVSDLPKITRFYKNVFDLHTICENVEQKDNLISELLRDKDTFVLITKLITDQGKVSGIDDMLELIQVKGNRIQVDVKKNDICESGCMHLGFGVQGIEEKVYKIIKMGGQQCTDVHVMTNGNKCCFCRDPEGNWLELIENMS